MGEVQTTDHGEKVKPQTPNEVPVLPDLHEPRDGDGDDDGERDRGGRGLEERRPARRSEQRRDAHANGVERVHDEHDRDEYR